MALKRTDIEPKRPSLDLQFYSLNRLKHHFLNIEQTRTCSSFGNWTQTPYFWLRTIEHKTSNKVRIVKLSEVGRTPITVVLLFHIQFKTDMHTMIDCLFRRLFNIFSQDDQDPDDEHSTYILEFDSGKINKWSQKIVMKVNFWWTWTSINDDFESNWWFHCEVSSIANSRLNLILL